MTILALAIIDDILVAMFWAAVAAGISYTITQLTQKDLDIENLTPSDLATTTTEEGVPYTIGFGTFWIENPVLAWWGDVYNEPNFDHYTVNKWFNNKRVYYVVSYNYVVGMQFILCQGAVDGIKQIKTGEFVAWPDISDKDVHAADGATSITIDEPYLFGGPKEGGGIEGTIDVMYGAPGQAINSYLAEVLGDDISACRGVTSVVLRGVNTGTSQYPKKWSFLVKRTAVLTDGTSQWYSAKANINGNLNAVHILRECYTNTEWGLAKATSLFDDVVWQAAADVIYAEELGLSMKWEQRNETLDAFINDVLRHIDAKLYRDPETGEYVIKLIRDDYVVGSLTEYDDDDVIAVSDFTRSAQHECVNTVTLSYWNTQDNCAVTITDHELALMDLQGVGEIIKTVKYYGVTDGDVAVALLARELQQFTTFPATCTVKGNRKFSAMRPGDVFKLTWPALGLEALVMRVLNVNLGTLTDGAVKLACIEDMFANQAPDLAKPEDSKAAKIAVDPANADDVLVYETSFYEIYLEHTDLSDAMSYDDAAGFVAVAASRPVASTTPAGVRIRAVSYGYYVLVRDGPLGDFYVDGDGYGYYTPNAALLTDMPMNAADITVEIEDADKAWNIGQLTVGSVAIVGGEVVKVLAVDTSSSPYTVTLARGCLDTVPAPHNGPNSAGYGDRLWFIGTRVYKIDKEYTDGDQPSVKVLTHTSTGALLAADAVAHNCAVLNSRAVRPYPPGDFKVNGVSYPSTFSGEPTVTWAHRDRTQQLDEVAEHSDVGIGPEAGTTYTLKIYDQNDVLVHTETGLTGTSFAYTWAEEMADCGLSSADPLNTQLRFVLYSVRDGFDSWQSYDLTVQRA